MKLQDSSNVGGHYSDTDDLLVFSVYKAADCSFKNDRRCLQTKTEREDIMIVAEEMNAAVS